MKWVAVAIVAFIIPYTFLTLHFRKVGPAFRPYEDTRNRVNNSRLLSAGYQRITLDAHRPAEPGKIVVLSLGGNAKDELALGGLPRELDETLIEKPILPVSIDRVTAAASISSSEPYSIQFTCSLPDNKEQLSDAHLYVKEGALVLVPSFEKLGGDLLARTRESTVVLNLPAAALKPGQYNVTLVGGQTSRRWTLQVH
jgi:hypothetical protein